MNFIFEFLLAALWKFKTLKSTPSKMVQSTTKKGPGAKKSMKKKESSAKQPKHSSKALSSPLLRSQNAPPGILPGPLPRPRPSHRPKIWPFSQRNPHFWSSFPLPQNQRLHSKMMKAGGRRVDERKDILQNVTFFWGRLTSLVGRILYYWKCCLRITILIIIFEFTI